MSRAQLTSTTQQDSGGAVAPFLAGKNKIINGDFGIWQRGTSFSNPTSGTYLTDRFYVGLDGSPTTTISRQSFTPGTAPVAGYESQYFLRAAMTAVSTTTGWNLYQRIENVQTFAGQTITVSFWAKADSSRTIVTNFLQEFGAGGSGTVFGGGGGFFTATTSWQRFSYTLTLPSIAGKTIGTGSSLTLYITLPISTTTTVDIWGVQVEAGSVATPFTTASGTLQGELSLCQRYYYTLGTGAVAYGVGRYYTSSIVAIACNFPVTMRATPSLIASTGSAYYNFQSAGDYTTSSVVNGATTTTVGIIQNNSMSGATAGQGCILYGNNAGASIAFSAEL